MVTKLTMKCDSFKHKGLMNMEPLQDMNFMEYITKNKKILFLTYIW